MIPRHLVIGTAAMLAIALGMSVYLWRIRGRVPHVEPAAYSGPIAPPVSGPTEQVTLYVADDDECRHFDRREGWSGVVPAEHCLECANDSVHRGGSTDRAHALLDIGVALARALPEKANELPLDDGSGALTSRERDQLMTPLRIAAYGLPVTHGIQLLQDFMLRGGTNAGWELEVLAVIGVVLFLLTSFTVRRNLRSAT